MCTAIAMKTSCGFFFGRNMDIDYNFGQKVIITPRNFTLKFRNLEQINSHYAIIGIASCIDGYPLYADAANEMGLCIAGLNFPGNAYYSDTFLSNKLPLGVFELIPYLLAGCKDVDEAVLALEKIELMSFPFREDIPSAPLHWLIADKKRSVTLEKTITGMKIYDNPYNVLTNNPPFDFHLSNAAQYANLRVTPDSGSLKGKSKIFGKGLGSFGLPGDFSPASRFVRSAYLLENSHEGKTTEQNITRFFHLLDSSAVIKGGVEDDESSPYYTIYSSCIDTKNCTYYFKTYDNSTVRCVSMSSTDLEKDVLLKFALDTDDFAVKLN